MKINLIATAIGASLYSIATISAAASLAPNPQDIVHQLSSQNFSQEQINKMQVAKTAEQTTMLANDGLNVQINRQHNKFAEEADITGEHVYVVRLNQQPVSLYKGGITGLQATHVQSLKNDFGINKLFDSKKPTTERVTQYQSYLKNAQNNAINAMHAVVGHKEVRKQFTVALNAYTVSMTQEEAKQVSELAEVAFVHRAKNLELHSDSGPKLIGAEQVWSGETTGVEQKGEGIIIGVIDTGINTDHSSFADVGADGYDHTNPWGEGVYVGDCAVAGQEGLCNDKLIGVHSYDVITNAFDAMIPGWPAIGEDFDGHGSHTASTAAGNVLYDVDLNLPDSSQADSNGIVLKEKLFPQISGVAPHANVIAYQVCYPQNEFGYQGCPWEAINAGIEDAIIDGVDVINMSIGGIDDMSPWQDGTEMAFFAAREAGINVAVSAGNNGQLCGDECFAYSDHASPWVMSVAATTHDRDVVIETAVSYAGFALDANGEPLGTSVPNWSETGMLGGAINTEELTGVVVWAKDYLDINGSKDWYGYCGTEYPAGTFDFYKDGAPIIGATTGDTNVIVICSRNNLDDPAAIARTAKVANVKAGGADGFIMYNKGATDGIPSVGYELPAIHLTKDQWNGSSATSWYGFRSWVGGYGELGHMVTLAKTVIETRHDDEMADWLAPFSSRGASLSTPEMLIPQVSAPGVNIYAAYSDQQPFSPVPQSTDFHRLSGTSMASPHVAGAMALVRQANPEWSATEVQSALALTADNVVKYHRLNDENDAVGKASTYRAGAGRINVANAIKSGLVMDETAENFLAANPTQGGRVHRLNTPQLVNMGCKPTCQWIRTVKATKDGNWKVSNSEVINWHYDLLKQAAQNGVTIKVTPSEFNLRAGETQNIVIEASIMDTQDWNSDAEVELHTDLIFDETSNASPQAHMPVVFKYDNNDMPSLLNVVAHRNNGSYQLKGLPLPEVDSVFARAFTPVKANVQTISLSKDDDATFPWNVSSESVPEVANIIDEATHVEIINVPANSKRLMVEAQGIVYSPLTGVSNDVGNMLVYVGKDYNGNGQADPQEEILCVSAHTTYNNYCNINSPDEGTYWAVFYNPGEFNWAGESNYPDLEAEQFNYAIAVISGDVASNLSVTAENSNGVDAVNATVSWDFPDMAEDDIYYSVVDFATSELNAGNIGKIALKIVRGIDDVTLTVPQDSAQLGDVLPLTFKVLPNDSGADRAFTITATMPETGLRFSAEDIVSASDAIESISVDGNVITISGTQPDMADVISHYALTTNIDDATCKMPNFGQSTPGGYVNLQEFNILPSFSGFNRGVDENGNPVGDNWPLMDNGVQIMISDFFGGYYDSFHLYDNAEQMGGQRENLVDIRANGILDLLGQTMPFNTFWGHQPFPYYQYPFESIGVFWRGAESRRSYDYLSVDLYSNPYDLPELQSGITTAYTPDGWGIIEYDNAKTFSYDGWDNAAGQYLWADKGDSYDFELVFSAETRFGANEHELYMAYDNIDFASENGRGSIGLQGFKGPHNAYGPMVGGYLAEQFAYDNLDEKITDGLVVCYDYVGPESSQFEVTIWTQVNRFAAGQDLTISTVSSVAGMGDFTLQHTVTVPSNLSLAAIDDQQVDEDETVAINVYYADSEDIAGVNQITVSGDNVTGVAESGDSGTMVTLTPTADFDGETMVTITVSDVENSADAQSTSFMLTVNSDGVDEVAEAEAAAAAAAAKAAAEAKEDSSNSGGSTGLFMLVLLGLLGLRRKLV